MNFPTADTRGFKKRKTEKLQKKHKVYLLVMDVFTLTLLQLERDWILSIYGARTSPTNHKVTFFPL